jgi:hypothetical protein
LLIKAEKVSNKEKDKIQFLSLKYLYRPLNELLQTCDILCQAVI